MTKPSSLTFTGEAVHEGVHCGDPVRINCDRNHHSNSKIFEECVLEKEILSLQVQENISFAETRERVKTAGTHLSPRPGVNFPTVAIISLHRSPVRLV